MVNNLTGLYNTTGFMDLIDYTNAVTGGMFAMLLLFSLHIIFVILLLRYSEPKDALLTSSFVIFIVSLFLAIANILNYKITIFYFIMVFGMSIYNYYVNNQY